MAKPDHTDFIPKWAIGKMKEELQAMADLEPPVLAGSPDSFPDESPDCQDCHRTLSLDPECEWGEEGPLCYGCLANRLAKAREEYRTLLWENNNRA